MSETTNYLTVSALTQYIKRKFDADPHIQRISVIGEVSNFRLRPTHQYFSLKDDTAVLKMAMFKQAFSKVPFELKEGMRVIATGRVSVYARSGEYQMTVETLQPDGIGALYEALQQLKEKFQKAGLFEKNQRQLERFPKKIAVITSPTGAVIRDILSTIKRRYPIVEVVVFPTRVQGEEAVQEIVAAFEQVKKVSDTVDTVILARGGGSIEDLWAFNEELVAQAILDCPIPVISSIGHETDTTISDFVADHRAPTPTAAAELSVPVLSEVLELVSLQQHRLVNAITRMLQEKLRALNKIQQSYIFNQPERLYQPYFQQLDQLTMKMYSAQQQQLQKRKYQLNLLEKMLYSHSPEYAINQSVKEVNYLQKQLVNYWQQILKRNYSEFEHLVGQLNAYSPLENLVRGYSVVTKDQQVVRTVKNVEVGQSVMIRVSDGKIVAKVQEIKNLEEE